MMKILKAIKDYPMSEPKRIEIVLYVAVLLGILWLAKHPIH